MAGESEAAAFEAFDGYTFLSAYMSPEDIAILRHTDEEGGAQAAPADEASHDIYAFLSAYLLPEDVSLLRRTDELSRQYASRRDDALIASIQARVRSQEWFVVGFDGGPERAAAAAVSGSVVAIASLERKTYGGLVGGDAGRGTGCVICVQDYKVGDELSVMPCSGRHRFHRECIAEWLACSHLCPLCRHELPTQERTRRAGQWSMEPSTMHVFE
jgi:hypothetical protein